LPVIGSSPGRPLGICARKPTAALAVLVNTQQRQPLAALFGAEDVSSSDGQHFPTAGPGEAVGAVNAHYERTASVLFYTHLSARQAPYHTVAIPPSGEAAYVIDGLLYHEADLFRSGDGAGGGRAAFRSIGRGLGRPLKRGWCQESATTSGKPNSDLGAPRCRRDPSRRAIPNVRPALLPTVHIATSGGGER